MYLEKIFIKNISANFDFSTNFTEEANLKPIVIFGENGSGKSTLRSNIIDSSYEISSKLFSNVAKMEKTGRKFYKIRSYSNISFGENKALATIKYKSKNIKKPIAYIDFVNCDTNDIKNFCSLNLETKSSKKTTHFDGDDIERLPQETQAHYYQLANRYEEPFWKNPNFNDSFKERKKYINMIKNYK